MKWGGLMSEEYEEERVPLYGKLQRDE